MDYPYYIRPGETVVPSYYPQYYDDSLNALSRQYGDYGGGYDFDSPGVLDNALLVGGAAALGLGIGEAAIWSSVTTNSDNAATIQSVVSVNTGSVSSMCAASSAIGNVATVPLVTAASVVAADIQSLASAINNIIAAAATSGC